MLQMARRQKKAIASNYTNYKKKKDPRNRKTSQHGHEGHHSNCECDACRNDYPLRTHLLLDMSSYTARSESDRSTRKSTTVSSLLNFFGIRKKSSTNPGREERPNVRVTFADPPEVDVGGGHTGPLEPVSISNLKQDCFLIPIKKLKNFFPAGHPIPKGDAPRLRMVETTESTIRILFHMMSPAVAFLPSLSSPLIDLHKYQQDCIVKAFKTTVAALNMGSVLQGMVLLNLEKGGELGTVEFPFMILWAIDTKRCDVKTTAEKLKTQSIEALDPAKTGFTSVQYIDTYEEVASLARPPLEKICRRATTPSTGYIISVFKVFEGDDGQKFERNWLSWSGARAMYCSMSSEVGLRRLTLHKSGVFKGFHHYVLLCDCANFLPNLCSAVKVVPKLRMRLCGDTGLYRPICSV